MADFIRWGILGARSGIALSAVAPAIGRSRNGKVTAVASRDPADIEALYGKNISVLTYEQLIATDNVDAVYIPLPNSMHFEWAKRAAEAGKAVLCEKPLAMNAAEAEALAGIFQRRGVKLMEGFMYRFHPQHQRIGALVKSGVVGDVLEIHAHLSVDLMNPPNPKNVRFKAELGGGSLLDMGCYGVSAARMIFEDEPSAVSGWWRIDEQFGVDIATAGILEFSRGRVAMVSCSFEGNGNGFYSIIGRKGIIQAPRALILGAGNRAPEALIISIDADGRRQEEHLEPFDQYRGLVEEFADAVLNDTPVPISLADSINNARVLDALAQSATQGRRVPISRFS